MAGSRLILGFLYSGGSTLYVYYEEMAHDMYLSFKVQKVVQKVESCSNDNLINCL